jgi:signal transduction histidine kinase
MAGELAAGRRDVRVPPESAGEVGAIARALNELGERLRSYEDALAARSRSSALGEMSARIAHEIRNPLTALQLQLQLLEERVPEAQRPTVVRLLDELRRLELIVASTLAEARAAQNRDQGRRMLSLTQVAREVLDLVEPSLTHRGVALERALREVPLLALDADRLKQALMNLLSNAADATGRDGRVRVTTRWDAQGPSAVLEVEDDGAGIDESRRGSLLSGQSGSAKPFGLGIGLKVCAEVATEHDGRLEIGRSEELGGARVSLVLPARPPDEARG